MLNNEAGWFHTSHRQPRDSSVVVTAAVLCTALGSSYAVYSLSAWHVSCASRNSTASQRVLCHGCCLPRRYSKVDMAGVNCPNLGRPGAGFCSLNNKCMPCPKVLYTVEEIIRCY